MSDAFRGTRRFRFGLFEVDVQSGELRRQGMRIKLQDQPFQVLLLLLERNGGIVTREEIQQRLWPDTIVEFESNLNAAIRRLRDALGDSAENPRFVETLPRRGYRFIAALASDSAEFAGAADPSIAVLPFRDRSPQENQEYFCDGLTEELTDALTKVENLRVVSRISAFQYKNKTDDVRKIGSELNVGTLLEGSLRKTENQLRISARLTSVKDGFQIWSGSYECDVREVFDVQEAITAAIVSALTEELSWKLAKTSGPELILSKPTMTKDPVAYDLYLRGLYLWNRKEQHSVETSIELFQRAIERDSGYALPHASSAEAYLYLASIESAPMARKELFAAGQKELETYLRMVRDNYEQKSPLS